MKERAAGIGRERRLARAGIGRALLGLEAEHKEHRIDHVRLAAAVWADDRRHVPVKGTNGDGARVRLEVGEDHLLDHQALRGRLGRRRQLRRLCCVVHLHCAASIEGAAPAPATEVLARSSAKCKWV